MRRGDLYRVRKPGRGDAKRIRVFVVVSRQALIDSDFSTVICAPVYSRRLGLATEVEVGTEAGLKGESSIRCDALVSLPKTSLTGYIGRLDTRQASSLDRALRIALAVD